MLKLFRNCLKLALCVLPSGIQAAALSADSIPQSFALPLYPQTEVNAGVSYVPPTNDFLRGANPYHRAAGADMTLGLKFGFRFSPYSRQGMLYRGLYQGIGASVDFFEGHKLLGRPASLYLYQGAPVARLSQRMWLGYEWQFGAAFGWKHYNSDTQPDNVALSTPVTAHIGLSLTLNYRLTSNTTLTLGVGGRHFSNGNTEWPNAGVNTLGVSVGVAYALRPISSEPKAPAWLAEEADRGRWMYDIVPYGAWRKHVIEANGSPELVPGHFAVAGLQFSPLRRLNRWVAVGPALDLQWDEGANLQSNWVEGSYGSDMVFYRPSFGSQLSVGVSAHAELTMPIFSVNAGLGYDFIKPDGDRRFYQSLTLKAFVWRNIFLNVGYRLAEFKTPQNLMLGAGIRL